MLHLPNHESLRVRIDHDQESAVLYWSGEVNMGNVPRF